MGGSDGDAEDARWRLRHLPVLLGGSAATAAVAVLVTAAVAGWTAAWGTGVGVAVAVASFASTTAVLAWLDRVARPLILPFGLALYVTKFTALGVLMFAVARSGWAGLPALAIGIVIGALAWVGMHIAWLHTRRGRPRLHYTPPA
ncbi:hypothetical protein GCM10010124_09370 [Pilimelia terevasa]|uniref:ATP synthase protein I n=1 Tax=Pilimelia terevasa TaxID=53372 RepID=A0A8J3FIG2_9ACTN|nr:hypothetical protein [Pilimelia terevasa]GGK18908.1 hypothetical protein GCM10010124_09370 [Pilimelia terevasa]